MTRYTLHAGDCREVLRDYPADHFDSIVSDPPYGLTFMGKGWDRGVPGVEFWQEALRVAKPGAHLLAFGGTRTFHRLTVAIEDAGWEIRDCVSWVYATGFPKSLDVSKAIDAAAGAEREVVGVHLRHGGGSAVSGSMSGPLGTASTLPLTAPATEAAQQWSGWGTALKPAWEPVIVARKPLDGTVAANVLRHGTGAINIDGCRVGSDGGGTHCTNRDENGKCRGHRNAGRSTSGETFHGPDTSGGRWPANLLHDGSDEVLAGFPDAEARFFYCAKASRTDREEGCDDLPARTGAQAVERDDDTAGLQSPRAGAGRTADSVRNFHPTVKPTDLMRYLCRLVTRPDGLVLDPFCGSGSTGKGALLEGFRFVGIDLDPAHVDIARARCQFAVDTIAEAAAAAEAPGAQLTLF